MGIIPAHAQEIELKGIVTDHVTKAPIKGAIINIRNKKNSTILSTIADANGKFKFRTNREKIFGCNILVSRMGYQSASCAINPKTIYTFELEPKAYVIQDVYVRPQKIIHHNDTTSYMVSSFVTNKDRTIGDVLRNMPGIDINNNGTISYNGKTIDKFMIEGLDLFDGQYNIATRNITHKIISRADIIENYHNAKALKNSKEEGGTVLNLAVKDSAKGHWSGNIKAALGLPKLWESELFCTNLSASNQTALTTKTNNSNKDILSENNTLTLEDLIRKKQVEAIEPLLNMEQNTIGILDKDRKRNATTHIINLGNIQKIGSNSTFRSKIYYTDDRNISNYEQGTSYYLADSILTRSTSERSILHSKALSASLSWNKDSEKSSFSNDLKYSSIWQKKWTWTTNDYTYNSESEYDIHTLENYLQWIKPIGKNYLKLYSQNKFTLIPEKLTVESDEDLRQQNINRKQFLSSTRLYYAHNIKRWALSIDAEEVLSASDINCSYNENLNDTCRKSEYFNNYICMNITSGLTYKHHGFRGQLDLPWSFYHYFGDISKTKIFFMPKLSLSMQLNSRFKIRANASAGTSQPSVTNTYNATILTDYQTYRTNPKQLYGNKKCSGLVSISYSDYINMLFANISVSHSKTERPNTVSKQIDNKYIYYTTIEGKNQSENIIARANMSKHVDIINGNINAICTYTSNSSNIHQNGKNTSYQTKSIESSLGINSNIKNWLDIDYTLSYRVNSLTNSTYYNSNKLLFQKMELSFLPTEALNFSIIAEHYVHYLYQDNTKRSFFGDIKCSYRHKKTDYTLSITNIFNQKYYTNTSYTDISSSYNRYTLRGRCFLAGFSTYF
ncbi:hypothetical protein PRRU23_11100 [Segatella bryantii]|jgi:hypothetical protein|nr:hypothetical protein PRRU23_11100 [Segatella bryantii]